MDPFGIFVLGALILGGVLFYSGAAVGLIVGLAIFVDLGTLGLLTSGAWFLIILTCLPTIGLNYAAYRALTDKEP